MRSSLDKDNIFLIPTIVPSESIFNGHVFTPILLPSYCCCGSPHPPTLRLVASRLRSQSIIHPNSNPLEIARRGCKYLQTSDVEFAVQVDVDDWLIINQTIESIKKENRSEMLKLLVKMN